MNYNDKRGIDANTPSCWHPNGSTGNYGQMAQGLYVEHAGVVALMPYKGSEIPVVFDAADHSIHDIPFWMLLDDTTATGLQALYKIRDYVPNDAPPPAKPPVAPATAK